MASNIYRTRVQKSQPFVLKNVLQLAIENYGNEEVILTLSDVVTAIPKATTVQGTTVPSLPYIIDSQVEPLEELRFSLDFPSNTGDVVVSYTTLKD